MSKWLPIESVPKNGSWVRLRGGRDDDSTRRVPVGPEVVAFWDQGNNAFAYAHWDSDWRSFIVEATEWLPIEGQIYTGANGLKPRRVLSVNKDTITYDVQGVLTLQPLTMSLADFGTWVGEAAVQDEETDE